MARVLHSDIAQLQPVRRLPNGTIVADAFLTRAGIFEYRNEDGSTRRELRTPEEVFNPASMRTFALVPATDDHPPEMITSKNATQYAKGSTGDNVTRDDTHLRGAIAVYDAATIAKMDAGKIEVSCGYTCDLEEVPGTHPLWGKYDAIQRNIVGNHVALVDKGRAGSTAAVRMDARGKPFPRLDAWRQVARMREDGGEWDEGQHPRAEDGKFGEGGGGSAGAGHPQPDRVPSTESHLSARPPGAGFSKPASTLTNHEKVLLTAMATTPKQRGSDSAVLKKLGISSSEAVAIAHGIRSKLGLSPGAELRAHAVAMHGRGELGKTVGAAGPASAPSRGKASALPKGAEQLTNSERLLLKTMATTPKQRGSDSNVLKKLGIQASTAITIGNGIREKLGLSPADDLRGAAVKIHKGGGTKFRTDSAIGTKLASPPRPGILVADMARPKPAARIEVVVRHDDGPAATGLIDPDDLANRGDAPTEVEDPADDEDMVEDAGDKSVCDGMYNDDGELSEFGANKVALNSFAVPGKKKLPMFDKSSTRDSMRKFGDASFDSADEKHAAFNRLSGRAKQFGINSDSFRRSYSGKLDRKDTTMLTEDLKAKLAKKTAKAVERKAEIAALTVRADKAETERDAALGKVASMTTDLENVNKARTDAADKFDAAVAAKVDLIAKATEVLGAGKVTAKIADLEIMKTVIKHVDQRDVTDTRPAYIEALFEGAVERHRKDATATAAGAAAIAGARAATVVLPTGAAPIALAPVAPAAHADAAEDTEDAARARAAARLRDRSRSTPAGK